MSNIDYYSKYKKYKRKYLLLQHGKGYLENKICSGKEALEKAKALATKENLEKATTLVSKSVSDVKAMATKENLEKVTTLVANSAAVTKEFLIKKETELRDTINTKLNEIINNDNFKGKFEIILKNNENIKKFFTDLLATVKDKQITDISINNIMQSHISSLKTLINQLCEGLEPKVKETTKNAVDFLEVTSKETLIFVCNSIIKVLIMLIINMPDLKKMFPHA